MQFSKNIGRFRQNDLHKAFRIHKILYTKPIIIFFLLSLFTTIDKLYIGFNLWIGTETSTYSIDLLVNQAPGKIDLVRVARDEEDLLAGRVLAVADLDVSSTLLDDGSDVFSTCAARVHDVRVAIDCAFVLHFLTFLSDRIPRLCS